jgi:hypothetical protein
MTARFVPFQTCHGTHPIPSIDPVTIAVANVDDAERWPEIAAALDHARKLRENGGG